MSSADEQVRECPSAEAIACFLDGTLETAAVAELEVHLSACDRCCSMIADLADVEGGTALSITLGGDALAREDRLAIGRLGRYTLLERVGAGGMGVVWAAYDAELERRVAIKLLRCGDGGSASVWSRRRLVREARAMARVSHPNVVAVHDVVEEDDRVFMTMELVTGQTLAAWLREKERSWRDILQVFLDAGRGLAAAHGSGVVHRDFKPDNVLVDDDPHGGRAHVRVGDFGLAHTDFAVAAALPSPTDDATAPLQTAPVGAALVGTPAYMAPEQFSGGIVDARTDQFAFCVALWEALYGTRPFAATSMAVLVAETTAGNVRAPADRRGVPARVERALRRGLARDPDARWPGMAALLRELQAASSPTRLPQWIALGSFVAAIAVALAWPGDEPCDTAPPWLAGDT